MDFLGLAVAQLVAADRQQKLFADTPRPVSRGRRWRHQRPATRR
jgi:hypothetical protein